MIITHSERRFRVLLIIWQILFSGGVLVMAVVAWLRFGSSLYTSHPLLALTWVGQVLLFLCSAYLFGGIRDNELCAPVLAWYKLASGTTMILLIWSRGTSTDSALTPLVGGLLDYVMGGLTFGFWLAARRSRFVRMPLAFDIEPSFEEEPDSSQARALRLCIAISAGVFSLTSITLLIASLFFLSPQSPTFKIAAGNAVAVYAALAFLCKLSAETPRRRAYALDVMLIASLLTTVALVFWTVKFQLTPSVRTWFIVGATLHLIIPITTLILSGKADRIERPKYFFGPWLHRVFERFAEVIIKGDIEVLTPREITDVANKFLKEIPSRRIPLLKAAFIFIELGALLKYRVPMSRLGRLEREHYLSSVFQEGGGLFRDLIKIKQLIFFIYYSDERTYQELDFVKFQERERYKKAKEENRLPTGEVVYPSTIRGRELETDVCVIGSGAGGAVVAARLAEIGKRVIILEEGSFLKRDRINHNERDMQSKAYREAGLQLTVDFDMYVLQGRCVGGSTFLNNGVCFDLPDEVLSEWENFGAMLDKAKLGQSFHRVRDELHLIKLAEHPHLPQKGSFKFFEGCCQWSCKSIPNVVVKSIPLWGGD